MADHEITLRAQFKKGLLVIVEASPELSIPPHDYSLTVGLIFLTETGWRVKSASFEGFFLNIQLEKFHKDQEIPYLYITQVTREVGDNLPIADKVFVESLGNPLRQGGWKLIAVSKPLADFGGGTCAVTFWSKPQQIQPDLPAKIR